MAECDCKVLQCTNPDDFFIPAPPPPPPIVYDRIEVCNQAQTAHCPPGTFGPDVTVTAGTFCQTLLVPETMPQNQRNQLVANMLLNLNVKASTSAQAALHCSTYPSPYPYPTPYPVAQSHCHFSMSDFSWGYPTIQDNSVGADVNYSLSQNSSSASILTVTSNTDVVNPGAHASVEITGTMTAWHEPESYPTCCSCRVTVDIISVIGTSGDDNFSDYRGTLTIGAEPPFLFGFNTSTDPPPVDSVYTRIIPVTVSPITITLHIRALSQNNFSGTDPTSCSVNVTFERFCDPVLCPCT